MIDIPGCSERTNFKSLFLAPPLRATSCNVHYSGSILYDNERETWSKSKLNPNLGQSRILVEILGEVENILGEVQRSGPQPSWDVSSEVDLPEGAHPLLLV